MPSDSPRTRILTDNRCLSLCVDSVLAFQNSIIEECRAIGGPGYQQATGGGMIVQQGAEVTFTNVTLSGCSAG
eukprot:5909328-Prymnesium_polylepis.1